MHRSTDTATDVARRENDKEQHRQKGSGLDKTSVPSPTNTDKKNNPKGDADVQRGYDKHQKEAEKKKNPGS